MFKTIVTPQYKDRKKKKKILFRPSCPRPGLSFYSYVDFIDRFKIFTKQSDNDLRLKIYRYGGITGKSIQLEKEREHQFFELRRYQDTQWKHKKKVPLMIFAASWADEQYGFERFCGVVHLAQDDPETEELLESSPSYCVISYVLE